MEKVCVFIDAGNFYHIALKKLSLKEVDFNFEEFVKFLASGREIIKSNRETKKTVSPSKTFPHFFYRARDQRRRNIISLFD